MTIKYSNPSTCPMCQWLCQVQEGLLAAVQREAVVGVWSNEDMAADEAPKK